MNFNDHHELHSLSQLSAPVWVFDTERYGIWWANAAALRFWKAESPEELYSRDFSTDSSSVRRRLSNIRIFGSDAPVRETWTLYPQDEPRRVLLSCQPITIAGTRQALLLEVVRDQPDLPDDIEATRVSEATRVADFHLSTFTLEGALLAQNPSAALCYGRGETGAEVELARRLGSPQLAKELVQRVADGEEFALEADMQTHTGQRRHLLSLRKGRDPVTGEAVAVLAEQDITAYATERKELEAQLLVAQRLEAVGQLTGGVAHDFNNLLTVVLGNAELMQERRAYDEALLSQISSAVQRGAQLTGQLLAFARKQTLNPQQIGLDPLLQRLKATLLRTLREDIRVDLSVPGALWDIVADPAQLEAAILNIAINARDAMPSGGALRIDCRNCPVPGPGQSGLPEVPQGAYVQLRITDTGEGIPGHVLPKVFEPFFTTKEVGKGSGLGLSMVQGFAQQSGGNCGITSLLGKGTSVTLVLPASPPAKTGLGAPSGGVIQRGSGQHVHVVDDDAAVRATVVRSVQSLGYRVTWSEDAETALRKVEGGLRPDLLLIDVVLPGGMSGIELAKLIQQRQPLLPLFLMSGHPGVHASDVEGSDWALLRKPFDRPELSRLLAERICLGAGGEV